jgi:hypothetical protein
MESWLGERIRKRLEPRKYQLQAQAFSGASNGKVRPSAQGADEQPTEASKDVIASVETDSAGILMRQSTDKELGVSVVSVPITAARQSDTPAHAGPSTKTDVDQPPSWWWARFINVRDTNRVSLQDAERCVKLVVAELRGALAPEISYQFQGDSVSLRAIYQVIGKLTGDTHAWAIVQTLMLRARKREGIQPNHGVAVLQSSVTQASAPWLREDGRRRQMEEDGAWTG